MSILRHRHGVFLFLLFLSLATAAQAVRASTPEITVFAPASGQVYSAMESIVVVYNAEPGSSGHHINVYVDEGRAMLVRNERSEYRITRHEAEGGPVIAAVIRDLSGHFDLGTLMPGHHLLTLEMVDKEGVPVGAMTTVAFTVQ